MDRMLSQERTSHERELLRAFDGRFWRGRGCGSYIADALSYLSRAAADAGYGAMAADILLVREKLVTISRAEKVPIPRRTHA
ncbi:hypothetical protein GCM10007857_85820 [Bradyrhizobium iriomotense]|uniref:Uncharacterized protein n=1 Tax=Bradyrhizobium iriomotense TaxID=441950 RepID=A0ABQ6BEJ9_9BRAD|nr:hypothetical protein GCM10007857_85820 [Bradyrhizobium iriomotense]